MERKCIGCDNRESCEEFECQKCGLKFCDYCGLVRNLCDDCFICYGELFNLRKFKNLKKQK